MPVTRIPAIAMLACLALANGAAASAAPRAERSAATIKLAARAAATAQLATDRRLIGQRLVYGFSGPRASSGLLRRIRQGHVAGVILFGQNVASREQTRALTARLQRAARRAPAGVRAPLLVMADQEGGAVRRLPGAPKRSAAEIGEADSAALARSAGRAAGRNLSASGINVNLAPVLDVARPGGAIADFGRGFSSDPRAVARLGGAFIRGLHDVDVAATAKHFPGFGAARVNTDDAPVTLDLALRTLRRIDEAPYRPAFDAGVELVMLSSAIYPALDPARPASFSRRVIEGELRRRLGFEGVTITDALGTPGVLRYGTPAQVAVRTVAAGSDLLLYVRAAEGVAAAQALERAVATGKLDRTELRSGGDRVLALRRSLR